MKSKNEMEFSNEKVVLLEKSFENSWKEFSWESIVMII